MVRTGPRSCITSAAGRALAAVWLATAAGSAAPRAQVPTLPEPLPPGLAVPETDSPPSGSIDLSQDDFASRPERDTVYRNDLVLQRLVPTPAAEWKPGNVYFRFHPGLGRHVWSIADAERTLRYALGPGSVQQTRNFDLRSTPEERQRALQSRAPEMARLLEIQGTLPTVRLDERGRWQPHVGPSVASVFDLETRQRWEWHGLAPVAVIHSGGARWTAGPGGRYLPSDTLRPRLLPVDIDPCGCQAF